MKANTSGAAPLDRSDPLAALERLARLGADHHPELASDADVTALVEAVRGRSKEATERQR